MRFSYDLGGGYSLSLRTLETAGEQHALILKNLERLKQWEHWAHEKGEEEDAAFIRQSLDSWLAGNSLPCNIYAGEAIVGSIELRINQYQQTGEIGYWIDADHEGHGVVTRACRALIEHGVEKQVKRFELHLAVENTRSAAVAERLGFTCEAKLAQAMRLGDERLDSYVYALIVD